MNWTTFLAGLAIGLWIAVVVLFLIPRDDEPSYIVVAGAPGQTTASLKTLWLPSGDGVYRCTNNDHGGGIVEDHGRGVVEDHGGGNVEDHGGGNVEDHGGGNVEDGAAHVPAPVTDRGYQQYWCDLNHLGGPVVKDRDGRVVAVAMPREGVYTCEKDPSGNAVVVTLNNKVVTIDHGGGNVEDSDSIDVDSGVGVDTPGTFNPAGTGTLAGAERLYCAVLTRDSDPTIVTVDGVVY
ncbi:MAG: hypothetical protein GY732_19530 [Gammaproteobacteria bacterium]|nr:hypothetical protein [Gammaproteobacteria bacterium]